MRSPSALAIALASFFSTAAAAQLMPCAQAKAEMTKIKATCAGMTGAQRSECLAVGAKYDEELRRTRPDCFGGATPSGGSSPSTSATPGVATPEEVGRRTRESVDAAKQRSDEANARRVLGAQEDVDRAAELGERRRDRKLDAIERRHAADARAERVARDQLMKNVFDAGENGDLGGCRAGGAELLCEKFWIGDGPPPIDFFSEGACDPAKASAGLCKPLSPAAVAATTTTERCDAKNKNAKTLANRYICLRDGEQCVGKTLPCCTDECQANDGRPYNLTGDPALFLTCDVHRNVCAPSMAANPRFAAIQALSHPTFPRCKAMLQSAGFAPGRMQRGSCDGKGSLTRDVDPTWLLNDPNQAGCAMSNSEMAVVLQLCEEAWCLIDSGMAGANFLYVDVDARMQTIKSMCPTSGTSFVSAGCRFSEVENVCGAP